MGASIGGIHARRVPRQLPLHAKHPGPELRNANYRIGLVSDTHGLLRPEALNFLEGCDCIVHGGDIGHPSILTELAKLAPVTAVRGNVDAGAWAESLPESEYLQVGEVGVYVIHDLAHLDIDPQSAGVRVIVSGHSHKPLIQERNGVLYANPGSAGPRRFKLPVTVGELIVTESTVSACIVELTGPSRPSR